MPTSPSPPSPVLGARPRSGSGSGSGSRIPVRTSSPRRSTPPPASPARARRPVSGPPRRPSSPLAKPALTVDTVEAAATDSPRPSTPRRSPLSAAPQTLDDVDMAGALPPPATDAGEIQAEAEQEKSEDKARGSSVAVAVAATPVPLTTRQAPAAALPLALTPHAGATITTQASTSTTTAAATAPLPRRLPWDQDGAGASWGAAPAAPVAPAAPSTAQAQAQAQAQAPAPPPKPQPAAEPAQRWSLRSATKSEASTSGGATGVVSAPHSASPTPRGHRAAEAPASLSHALSSKLRSVFSHKPKRTKDSASDHQVRIMYPPRMMLDFTSTGLADELTPEFDRVYESMANEPLEHYADDWRSTSSTPGHTTAAAPETATAPLPPSKPDEPRKASRGWKRWLSGGGGDGTRTLSFAGHTTPPGR